MKPEPSLPPAGEALAARCAAGAAVECQRLASATSKRHPELALTAYEKACAAGLDESCADLGLLYLSLKIGGVRVERQLGSACSKSVGRACRALADINYGRKNARAAVGLYSKGCRTGDELACERAGILYFRGEGTLRNVQEALDHLSLACARGSIEGCFLQARILEREDAGVALAERLFEKGCARKHQPSCVRLAAWQVDGIRSAPNCAEALRLSRPACAAGDNEACAIQGQCELSEPNSAELARKRLHRACVGDSARACHALGRAISTGMVTSSAEAALVYLERGCRLESPAACTDFATQMLQGTPSQKDALELIQLLEYGCNGGVVDACVKAVEEYESGKHVPAEPGRAALFRERACRLGRRDVCKE